MSDKKLKTRIQLKHDLEVNWNKADSFIPMAGELIIYDIEVDADGNIVKDSEGKNLLPEGRTTPYDYARFKIGNGIDNPENLPFFTSGLDNLEDAAGFGSIQQVADGVKDGFDFTDKNYNATAIDRTLTGIIPYGATGEFATAFGGKSAAIGKRSLAEGTTTIAKGKYSHAEGDNSVALGNDSHAEGYETVSAGQASHSEGYITVARGTASHAEGVNTTALGSYSHAEGYQTLANGNQAHAEGTLAQATGTSSHAEGYETTATGAYSHAEGQLTIASGENAHAEGLDTTAYKNAHAEGYKSRATANQAHAEGYNTRAQAVNAHAEGEETLASAQAAHAEGNNTIACGAASHAEGTSATASGDQAHAEGSSTTASGLASHAEGYNNTASGNYSHAGGSNSTASHLSAFVHGDHLKTSREQQTVVGTYNADNGRALFIVGSGAHEGRRGNALEVLETGEVLAGADPQSDKGLVTKRFLNESISNLVNSAPETLNTLGELATAINNHEDAYDALLETVGNKVTAETGKGLSSNDFTDSLKDKLENLNIGNSATAGGIQQAADKVAAGFDFTGKNANATAIDSTLTGIIPYGATGQYAAAFGGKSAAIGKRSLAEGTTTIAKGDYSHAEGSNSVTLATSAHAEGAGTTAAANYSHAEGNGSIAKGIASHVEGSNTTTIGQSAHAEGYGTSAGSAEHKNADGTPKIDASHAEGYYTSTTGIAAHAEGYYTSATDTGAHAEGIETVASGYASHAEGEDTVAEGGWSHTEGYNTKTSAAYAHAEGSNVTASGMSSHAEGNSTIAAADSAHAEGGSATVYVNYGHAEGWSTRVGTSDQDITAVSTGRGGHAEGWNAVVTGDAGHAEGKNTVVSKDYAHAEGYGSKAEGIAAHAEGENNTAKGGTSHAEGVGTTANGYASHTEGVNTKTSNKGAHAEGESTTASGIASNASGYLTTATGDYSHAKGVNTVAYGRASHAEGNNSFTSGSNTHAEGYKTNAIGDSSHAEGISSSVQTTLQSGDSYATINQAWNKNKFSAALGAGSHSEGKDTIAYGECSHTEGYETKTAGHYTHAEGYLTEAVSQGSHAEGSRTVAAGIYSHAEGVETIAEHYASHASGHVTKTSRDYQTVIGEYNLDDSGALFIVGNGDSDNTRRNAFEVLADGTAILGTRLDSNKPYDDNTVATVGYVNSSSKLISVTYEGLKDLRDSSALIPGAFYRITDYKCTTSQEDTRAVNSCKFNIVVQALSTNRLSENAQAAQAVGAAGGAINVPVHYRIPVSGYANIGHAPFEVGSYEYDHNNEGIEVPILLGMWTDPETEDKVLSGDVAYYEGRFELDGLEYDRWRVIEAEIDDASEFSTWDSESKKYILTNPIITDNTFTINDVSEINVAYVIYDDMDSLYGPENAIGDDAIVAVDYMTKGDGSIVPIMYKTDLSDYADEPDYEEPLEYVGRETFNGIEYDKWQHLIISESGDYSIFAYWLTDIIVDENGQFTDKIFGASGINFEAWELKYCLDNDSERFAWADPAGKGVIYYMKDEWNNECPYDFKNIQFIRPIFVDDDGYITYDPDNGEDTWVYTFTAYDMDNGEYFDASIITGQIVIDDGTPACYGNNIRNQYLDPSTTCSLRLNDIVFLNTFSLNNADYFYCFSNTFGNDCFSNTFGNSCNSNAFGISCNFNTFGHGCYFNTFGNYCYSNTFGIGCNSNTFGNSCTSNTFGNYCYYNTFGNSCTSNTFGITDQLLYYVYYTKFNSGCSYIRLLNTETASNDARVQNVVIGPGVCGTYGNYRELQVQRNAAPVVFEAAGTTHIILD